MLWPILRTPGASSSGFRSASASDSAIWPSTSAPPPNRSSAPIAVPDRDVAGLSRLDRHRYADEFGLHRVERRELRHRSPRRPPLRAGDPGGKSAAVPHGRVGGAVDRGARLGRAGVRRGRPAPRLEEQASARSARAQARSAAQRRSAFKRRRSAGSPLRPAPSRGADEARVRLDRGRCRRRRFRRPGG